MTIDPTAHPAPQAWTPENPPPGSHSYALVHPQSPESRRAYFQALTQILVSSGLKGDRVGEIVAELDDHVAMSGQDPVIELGPAGEFADALLDATDGANPGKVVGLNALLGATAGAAIAALTGFFYPDRGGGTVFFDASTVLYGIVLGVSLSMSFWKGSKNLIGRPTMEWRSMKWFAIITGSYLTLTLALGIATRGAWTEAFEWTIPVWSAFAIVGVSAVAGAGVAWHLNRYTRVSVPGRAKHLRRVG